MAKTPPADEPTFKVAETREDGTVIVVMENGAMFPAEYDGERLHKGHKVELAYDGHDDEGVPLNPKIVG